jgi:hypothetical protein
VGVLLLNTTHTINVTGTFTNTAAAAFVVSIEKLVRLGLTVLMLVQCEEGGSMLTTTTTVSTIHMHDATAKRF